MKALIAAHQRGADIKIVPDRKKGNRNRAGMVAMNLLVNAGIVTRPGFIRNKYADPGTCYFVCPAKRRVYQNLLPDIGPGCGFSGPPNPGRICTGIAG
ncbi:hypothetical protein DU52_08505 [Methanosarcina mazei]|uniref:Uncharacterized protein n=2 Tax=Methanosarcina mazei TaxID=2209 RepID=A0A0F8E607_METMZ|nr:hypothetical protein DU52_08505 [Methanosarcina mazei]